MKFRIVEKNNGECSIQYKKNLFSDWKYFTRCKALSDANYFIKYIKENVKEVMEHIDETEKGEKVKRVINIED